MVADRVTWHVQAKDAAHAAANAAHRSAKATSSALERMTQAYTNSRQYYMLDDLVEATGAAKKVRIFSLLIEVSPLISFNAARPVLKGAYPQPPAHYLG